MLRFILRRLLLSIPVLLGVILLVFVLARVIPSDPCRAALQERATPALCDAFNTRFGLNDPLPVQFVRYMGQVATLDLGDSIRYNRPVSEIIFERLPLTIELTVLALLFVQHPQPGMAGPFVALFAGLSLVALLGVWANARVADRGA